MTKLIRLALACATFHAIASPLVAQTDQRSCRFARATIEGTRVLLVPLDGPAPTRVRFCWADSPVCTLFDQAGLPAGPFELPIQ
jgi:hypothetical protein